MEKIIPLIKQEKEKFCSRTTTNRSLVVIHSSSNILLTTNTMSMK